MGKSLLRIFASSRLAPLLAIALIFSTAAIAVGKAPAQPADNEELYAAAENLKLSDRRWIEIRLRSQRLFAWEGDRLQYAVVISTGKDATPTPTGRFAIYSKLHPARMTGIDYDLNDVPYTMYYYGGYAIHGAYWHNRFGTPVSHGCINVAENHARWLYRWASVGTPVVVRR